MNENMSRLKDLIGEVNKTIQNLEAETKEMRKKNIAEKEKQYRSIVAKIYECATIASQICSKYTPCVKINDKYEIELLHIPSRANTFMITKEYVRIEAINYTCSYEALIYNHRPLQELLDEIIEAWDETKFEIEFTKEMEKIITKVTENANAKYEAAKRGEI